MRKRLSIIVVLVLCITGFGLTGLSGAQDPDIAGTFYGRPISRQNYNFVLRVVLSFNSPWGGVPDNRDELEKRIWDDLILSYEAYRRQIEVSDKELSDKIQATLKSHDVAFDRKEDPEAYAQWIREKLGVSVAAFENQMLHLVQVKKLYDQVIDSINPSVSEEEAYQEFLNEYTSLSVEVAKFNTLEGAEEFYENIRADPDFWDQARAEDLENASEDRSFRKPGYVALEFLMYMWKFPKEAVFEMSEMDEGDFYAPQPIYKGYGVFKVLKAQPADESLFPDRREYFYDQLRKRKKEDGFWKWLESLKEEADVQAYIEAPYGIFP